MSERRESDKLARIFNHGRIQPAWKTLLRLETALLLLLFFFFLILVLVAVYYEHLRFFRDPIILTMAGGIAAEIIARLRHIGRIHDGS